MSEYSARFSDVNQEHNEAETDILLPNPSSLIESMRAFGYSVETAISDLVDNSITANAKNIEIRFRWNNGTPEVSIVDDGFGMSSDQLTEAMRLGSTSPLASRNQNDLGRFGLGLKTASFSQARELTVISKRAGEEIINIARWDLDHVMQTQRWEILRSLPKSILRDSEELSGHGTEIIWTKCDHLEEQDNSVAANEAKKFNSLIERTVRHLEQTFHLFLEGSNRITIKVNGNQLKAWDPFMKSNPATLQISEPPIAYKGTDIRIEPFILPHKNLLTEIEFNAAAGIKGWNQQQGFYVYRNKRLIVAGDWLQTGATKDEHMKLARIAIHFDSEIDMDWQLNVMKSIARPPSLIRDELTRIARATRAKAEEVYRHRGQISARMQSQTVSQVWVISDNVKGERTYRINKRHPIIASLIASASDSELANQVLKLIEKSVPVTAISLGISMGIEVESSPYSEDTNEVVKLLTFAYNALLETGSPNEEAIATLASCEPFISYPEIVDSFKEAHPS